MKADELREHVAMAIYECAFDPYNSNADQASRRIPSPGWAWERTSEEQRAFARRQAEAAIVVMAAYIHASRESKSDARRTG